MTTVEHITPLLKCFANTCGLAFELRCDCRVTRISPPSSRQAMPLSADALGTYLSKAEPFRCFFDSGRHLIWGIPFPGYQDNSAWLLAHTTRNQTTLNNDSVIPLLEQILSLADANHQLTIEIEEMAAVLDQSFEELSIFGRIEEVVNPEQYVATQLPAICDGLRGCLNADLVFVRVPDCREMTVTLSNKDLGHIIGNTNAFIDALLTRTNPNNDSADNHFFYLNDSRQVAAFNGLCEAPFRYLAAQAVFDNKSYGWIGVVSFDYNYFFKRSHMRILINTAAQIALLAANKILLRGLDQLTSRVEKTKGSLAGDFHPASACESPEGDTSLAFLSNAFSQMCQSMEAGQTLLAKSAQMATVGQLASIFAHEIKQPLTALGGLVQITQRETGSVDDRDIIERISAIVDRMITMVKRFGSFTKPAQHILEPVNLNHITREAYELITPQLTIHNIHGDLQLDDAIPRVTADTLGLQQVVLNLVNNAIQAMLPNDRGRSELRLRSYHDRDFAYLVVMDTGHGIDQAHYAKIFKPYYSTKPPGEGTGLGLAVAKDIMEQAGGSIEVESTPNEGSHFTLKFPITENRDITPRRRYWR